MKIEKLYFVTKPTPRSTLDDVCFAATLKQLDVICAGGLSKDDILAMFTSYAEAKHFAMIEIEKEFEKDAVESK